MERGMKGEVGALVSRMERGGKQGGETENAAKGWSLLVLTLTPPVILES